MQLAAGVWWKEHLNAETALQAAASGAVQHVSELVLCSSKCGAVPPISMTAPAIDKGRYYLNGVSLTCCVVIARSLFCKQSSAHQVLGI